ncbi:MAG: TonB-dependent receptor [Flavobacterium psychrophilum]
MKSIFLVLFMGMNVCAIAQQRLSGKVTDDKNTAQDQVIVSIPELHLDTQTNEQGEFYFLNLPNTQLNLSFSKLGFESMSKSIDTKTTQILAVQLTPSIFEMDEVIVSTGFRKMQSQNVMKVTHLSLKSLQKKGEPTLMSALSSIPGVDQLSTGTAIGKPVIRGLSGNRILVYTQGVRLENQQFGEEHGLGINEAGIESVEVIKGPASLLYGPDAIGGVLYFNPEKFASANQTEWNFSEKYFSNTQGSNRSLGYKLSGEKSQFLVRITQNQHADYQVPAGDRVTNTRFQELDFKTGLGFTMRQMHTAFRYSFNSMYIGIPEGEYGTELGFSPLYPKQELGNHLASWNTTWYLPQGKIETDLGYGVNFRSEFEDSTVPNLAMKLSTFNYKAAYFLPKKGGFESILGLQGMNQTNANSGQEFLIPNAHTRDLGFFGTWNYSWKKQVVQAGFRWDERKLDSQEQGTPNEMGYFPALQKNYSSWNAALGYKTNLSDPVVVRFNVATGFRAPNLAELTSNGVHEGSNRYEIGNPNLKTEQNVQTDLNLEYKISHFEFFVNGFYNHINNFIYISPTAIDLAANDVYQYEQNQARLWGGELGLHLHPHPLDWLHLESSIEQVTGQKANGEYLPLIPANRWNNRLRSEFTMGKWLKEGYGSVELNTTFAQTKRSTFETNSKGYSLVNVGLGGTLKFGKTIMDCSLNANNLFNVRYIPHLSRLKSDGIPNPGRSIVLGINFTI